MYAYIRGIVAEIREDRVIIECGGIGYRVFVPSSVPGRLGVGEEVKLHTHFSVREDAMQLFGFLSEDDLELYRLLLSVSGVGPKGALGILSVLDADDLRFAVLSDDAAVIAKAPGIGKKTAQKVIIELKDKLDLEDAFEKKAGRRETEGVSSSGGAKEDAAEALVSLGYSRQEALRAVRAALAVLPDADAEELIRAALRSL